MPLRIPAVLGGTSRLGGFRLGYLPASLTAARAAKVTLTINGVAKRWRLGSLQIRDVLNADPNTCDVIIDNANPPSVGQIIRVTVGTDTPALLFAGTIQTAALTYQGKKDHPLWPCTAIDNTARLNRRRPFATWVNASATDIAHQLVSDFAPDFGTAYIEAGLPLVSIIFDGSTDFIGCLTALATAIGGYCKVEDLDVYLFLEDTSNPPDAIDTTPGRLENTPPIDVSTDVSQLRTRIFGKGHGEALLGDVYAGETILPIGDATLFNPTGGLAIAGVTADGAQAQRIAYTGVALGGAGSLAGLGASPAVGPSLAQAVGAGLGTGSYQYAYTDVTAAGESLPSPRTSISVGDVIADPTAAPTGTFTNLGAGGPYPFVAGDATRQWAYTFVTAAGESLPSPTYTPPGTYPMVGGPYYLQLTGIATGPASVTSRKVYRTVSGGTQLKLVATIANNTATTCDDHTVDGSLGANVPTSNTAGAGNQVVLSAIALGPASVTSRKIYRTTVGGVQLKLQQTIANNSATVGVQDATADGSLGANAPTSDTSGLSFSGGQVNVGSTTIVLASAGPFPASGWAIAGQDIVRYTGITGNTLTGVPSSGPGALFTTLLYGSQILPAPALTGVTDLLLDALKGSLVHIWVQRDDVSAQATQAAADVANGITPADGLYEGPVVVDDRRGEESLVAVCDANLALYSAPIVTFTYATRDVKTRSGKTVHIDLPGYPAGDYIIQDVTISELGTARNVRPKFLVTASTVRHSFDDLLRRILDARTV